MKSLLSVFALSLLLVTSARAQDVWNYVGEIAFPVSGADTVTVRPYLSTVDADGNLWVISSTATDTLAHNALWKAEPGAEEFTLVQNFSDPKDDLVVRSVGITARGNDILVANIQVQSPTSQIGNIYLYAGGDPAQRTVKNSANGFAGYGTFVYGIDVADNNFVYAAMSFQTSMRVYDFRPESDRHGSWVPMDPPQNTEVGGHDGTGISAMRDIAVIPGADYSDPETPFFTSRNRYEDFGGGIAVWRGGTSETPEAYTSARLGDFQGDLALSGFISTGITADSQGRIWVSGPDSTRRWVKAYEVIGDDFAVEATELPSSTSMDVPNPAGAPFNQPNDVALNAEETMAYVIDRAARLAWVFARAIVNPTELDELPGRIDLHQNYPNPFNPSTTIRYEIAEPGYVRLTVLDMLGREVAILADGHRQAGQHIVSFNAGDLASGAYLYRLEANGHQVNRTLFLRK